MKNENIFNSKFTITIDDGFCKYEYPLRVSGMLSINMIAKKIFKSFKLKYEDGVFIKPKYRRKINS
jgi:hypothetical protein